MSDVAIGSAIVALIEPHAGQEQAFNRWYEGDHYYAAVTAPPGAFAGKRWVATRACKDARYEGTLFGDYRRGSYLTTAWVLPGMQAQWDAWVTEQMQVITAEGRLFPGRDHVHTAVYSTLTHVGPATYALDRGYPGVVAIAAQCDTGDAVGWMHDALGTGIDAAVLVAPQRVVLSQANPGDHVLVLAFCTDDPIATFHRLDPLPNTGFASPFLATVPGTDTYADEL